MFKSAEKDYPDILPVLTSLRFWAAFAVAFQHCCMLILENAAPDLTTQVPIISKLYLGVDFFFILSGFVLTHVYLEKLRHKTLSVRGFYVKRIARIYPAYLCAFVIALTQLTTFSALGITDPPDPSLSISTILLYLFCFHAWWDFHLTTINGPSWSISVEWFAYLVFPLLLILYNRTSLYVGAFITLLALAACWLVASGEVGQPLTRLDFDFGILRIIPEFMGGIWLYKFGKKYELRYFDLKAFCALTALMLGLMFFLAGDFWIVLTFSAFIFLGAEQARQNYHWSLCSGNALYLGEISYSVYLLHIPLLEITLSLMKLGHFSDDTQMALLFLALLAVLPAAMLSYALIETPMRRSINKRFGQQTENNKTEKTGLNPPVP
ncbi:MAG: acyltransferase [Alphaproteobacteria bacterium]|nr:acyltransferase [Alphaproteobacteria bacterium]